MEQNRTVYAVPGRITDVSSKGCNRLIADGAMVVTDFESLPGELGLSIPNYEKNIKNDIVLARDEKMLYSLLLDFTPKSLETLVNDSGMSPAEVLRSLTCLEIKGIILELNAFHSPKSIGIHDVYEPLDPPMRKPIMIEKVTDRIGTTYLQLDPNKIVGVVECNIPDEARTFKDADPITDKIGENVANFLMNEKKRGIIPSGFLPFQSGVGTTANAILFALGSNPDMPAMEVYTEVLQNAIVDLMFQERVKCASTCSLTVTNDKLQSIYDNMDFFKDKLVLRPSEISNNAEVIRRLGLIAINAAI